MLWTCKTQCALHKIMISIKKRTDFLVTQEQKLGARDLHAQLEHSLELEVFVTALPGC